MKQTIGFRVSELGEQHSFELEACRSLLAMFDSNRSAVLEWKEVKKSVTAAAKTQQLFTV